VPMVSARGSSNLLRGKDLNLRPSGYEETERTLLGLVSLWIRTLAQGGASSTLLGLRRVVIVWPQKWPQRESRAAHTRPGR
jgi:hypothetical protein